MNEVILKRLEELFLELDAIDKKNIISEMNGLMNSISNPDNKNELAELYKLKEMFGNLSKNMLSLSDFLERKFPEK